MDANRKKALREGYKTRRPDMGVLAITCVETGDRFLFLSRDAATGFNRHTFQLSAGMHPNKVLQALWDQQGREGFSLDVVGLIEYDDPQEDQNDKLEALLEQALAQDPQAKKL